MCFIILMLGRDPHTNFNQVLFKLALLLMCYVKLYSCHTMFMRETSSEIMDPSPLHITTTFYFTLNPHLFPGLFKFQKYKNTLH
jgi:hypothetical protein